MNDLPTCLNQTILLALHFVCSVGISLAMAQCVEVTYLDINKVEEDLDCWRHLQTVLQDTVDTAVHIITFMLDMLCGKQSTDTSMTILFCWISFKLQFGVQIFSAEAVPCRSTIFQ